MIKNFSSWLSESAPTNVSAGTGVRGLGDVTGQPAGSISNYAAANAIANGDSPDDILKAHRSMHVTPKKTGQVKS